MSLMLSASAALGLVLLYDGLTRRAGNQAGRLTARVASLMAEAGLKHLGAARLYVGIAALFIAVTVVAASATDSFPLALLAGLAAGWAPIGVLRARVRARRKKFRQAWPDAIAELISAVRAGISLAEACVHLAERGPEDLRAGFISFTSSYRASGSFQTGLSRLQEELADPIADRVVVALTLANEVGGTDLVRVLTTISDFVREELRVRREIEARWSWTVTAARVAAAAPWLVLLMMATRPEASSAYSSPAGLLVIAVGAMATLVGYRLMLRAAQLPEERRLGR